MPLSLASVRANSVALFLPRDAFHNTVTRSFPTAVRGWQGDPHALAVTCDGSRVVVTMREKLDWHGFLVYRVADGTLLHSVGGAMSRDPPGFWHPRVVATAPDDFIYVADTYRIQVFTPSCKRQGAVTIAGGFKCLYVDDACVFAVMRVDPTRTLVFLRADGAWLRCVDDVRNRCWPCIPRVDEPIEYVAGVMRMWYDSATLVFAKFGAVNSPFDAPTLPSLWLPPSSPVLKELNGGSACAVWSDTCRYETLNPPSCCGKWVHALAVRRGRVFVLTESRRVYILE